MSQQKLRAAIDRMVEESIRRILPTVMNEVLVKTIANSGVIREQRPVPRTQRQSQPQVPGRKATPKAQKATASLRQLLDEQAGAEFYEDPRDAMREHTQEDEFDPGDDGGPPLMKRIEHLNPELRQLAEGMSFEDDGVGEMWDDGELDSAAPSVSPRGEIRDPARVAESVGLDFNRIAKTISATSVPQKRVTGADAAAHAQFEEQRLKRKREALNGGKPLE